MLTPSGVIAARIFGVLVIFSGIYLITHGDEWLGAFVIFIALFLFG
jgi:ABC-type Mn2+/Zn2+ transport system permease subunit